MDQPTSGSLRTFFGISSFQALAMFRRGMFYSFLSVYLRYYLGLTVTETTLFATLPMVLNIVFQTFVWGRLSDRYQLRRTLIIWGELSAGVGTILVWYAHRLTDQPHLAGYVVIIGLSVIEIFWSMSNIGWSALISDIYREADRNAVQGRLASVGGIGRIAGVWIGGLLYDGLNLKYDGWGFHEGSLFFVAAGVMILSVFPLLWVPEGGIHMEPGGRKEEAVQPSADAAGVFTVFLVAMVFINFGRNSIAVIMAQYLVLDSGFAVSSQTLSHIVNTQSAAMILTGLVAGWLGRRIGDGWSMCLGALVATASLGLITVTGSLPLIYVGNFLRGASEVIIMAASYAFASVLIPPEKRGRLFSVFNATFFLSWGLAGTFIAGPIIDILISRGTADMFAYRMAFLSATILTLIGLIIQAWLVFSIKAKGDSALSNR